MSKRSRGRELKHTYPHSMPYDEHWIFSKNLKKITVIKQQRLWYDVIQ